MSKTVEIKTLALVREPPGDRWREPNGTEIFPTLTSGLEHVFRTTACKEYRFSAVEGKVFRIEFQEAKAPAPVKFSLYGEE